MKLYVTDESGTKKYLSLSASSRSDLANQLGSQYLAIDGVTYHVSQVNAEKTGETTPVSTVLGGAIGLVGGMPGVLIGGALGALFGNDADNKDKARIEAFNRS
jgi:hypothetical protein